jgi:CopG family nickel-responsive transcriptional regulator
MDELIRIGVAIERDLLERFDAYIDEHRYPSRSEAFRDLIRAALERDPGPGDEAEVVGTVTMVYDHAARRLADRVTSLQHDHHHTVISSMHVHLDHEACLEVIVLRSRARSVRALADSLIAMKGVRHGQLVLSSA